MELPPIEMLLASVSAVIAILVAAVVLELWREVRSLSRRVGPLETAGSAPPRVVHVPAREARDDGKAEDLKKELDELRSEVAALQNWKDSRPTPFHSLRQDPWKDPAPGDYPQDGAEYSSLPVPPPPGKPVELQDGSVVVSRSLTAPGSLVVDGSGTARLYLNESVEINHLAFDQWSAYFDFQGGKPYMRYATRVPSLVRWNESAGRGELERKGVAEPRA